MIDSMRRRDTRRLHSENSMWSSTLSSSSLSIKRKVSTRWKWDHPERLTQLTTDNPYVQKELLTKLYVRRRSDLLKSLDSAQSLGPRHFELVLQVPNHSLQSIG